MRRMDRLHAVGQVALLLWLFSFRLFVDPKYSRCISATRHIFAHVPLDFRIIILALPLLEENFLDLLVHLYFETVYLRDAVSYKLISKPDDNLQLLRTIIKGVEGSVAHFSRSCVRDCSRPALSASINLLSQEWDRVLLFIA